MLRLCHLRSRQRMAREKFAVGVHSQRRKIDMASSQERIHDSATLRTDPWSRGESGAVDLSELDTVGNAVDTPRKAPAKFGPSCRQIRARYVEVAREEGLGRVMGRYDHIRDAARSGATRNADVAAAAAQDLMQGLEACLRDLTNIIRKYRRMVLVTHPEELPEGRGNVRDATLGAGVLTFPSSSESDVEDLRSEDGLAAASGPVYPHDTHGPVLGRERTEA